MEIIDWADLELGKFLGQGAEGTVHAAWYLETPVAVKQTTSVQEIEMNLHAGACCLLPALEMIFPAPAYPSKPCRDSRL